MELKLKPVDLARMIQLADELDLSNESVISWALKGLQERVQHESISRRLCYMPLNIRGDRPNTDGAFTWWPKTLKQTIEERR